MNSMAVTKQRVAEVMVRIDPAPARKIIVTDPWPYNDRGLQYGYSGFGSSRRIYAVTAGAAVFSSTGNVLARIACTERGEPWRAS